MTTRFWNGGTADWFAAAQWSGDTVPGSGDVAVINSGTVQVTASDEAIDDTTLGATLFVPIDGVQVTLGSVADLAPAVLAAADATFGQTVTIDSNAAAPYAALDATGAVGLSGTILASAAGGTFDIAAIAPSGTQPASFDLLHDGFIYVSGGDDLVLTGSMVTESNVTIAAGSTFTNNGLDAVFGGTTFINSDATLTGTGTFEAGPGATLNFQSAVPAGQTIVFGQAGRLDLSNPASFAGQIEAFTLSDTIDLLNIAATSASYNASTGTLAIDDGESQVAALAVQGPASSMVLNTTTDGAGGTLITFPGSASRTSYEIDDADQALQADLVRTTMTTAAGVPITGAGITIGIMSDSFNATLNGIVDPADTAAAEGYLPENANGTSAVDILQDSSISGVENEGLAMAELVHQIAPGASIMFYTAEGGQASFAQGVTALVNAGANIIVDDWSFSNAPFYQLAGPVDTAIENAVSAGVDYFTAASNYGNGDYESTFQGESADLVLSSGGAAQAVTAQDFGNGASLQTITIPADIATTIFLQWDSAWPSPGVNAADPIAMVLYDAAGDYVGSSVQAVGGSGYGDIPEIGITVPVESTSTQYELAIYQLGATNISNLQFKYILFGTPSSVVATSTSLTDGSTTSAQDPGGTIDEPAGDQGSGTVHGQELIPGVNTVGAVYWANSPAFGGAGGGTEYFSSVGPGELLFNQYGTAVTPSSDGKVNFLAPDGVETSVPGFQAFFGSSAAAPDAAAVAALMLQADPSLTTAQVTDLLADSAVSLGLPSSAQGNGLIQADTAVQLALDTAASCFAAGTRIATARGAVPVEDLRVGERVRLADGGEAPLVWLGRRRVDCRRHPRPDRVWPVRIRAGAFGGGLPLRDVYLSPDHAVYADGVLIPVRRLINDSTIAQVPVDAVTYYHVELPCHAVLLAEDLPAESYLDTGDRGNFERSGRPMALHPDFAMRLREAAGCAPLVVAGPELAAVRRRLNAMTMTAAGESSFPLAGISPAAAPVVSAR